MTAQIYDFAPPAPAIQEPPRFISVPTGPRLGFWSLCSSVMVHTVALMLLIVFSRYMAWLHADDVDLAEYYRVEPIRLHLAGPIYYKPPVSGGPSPAASDSGRLQLPPSHHSVKNAPVILQPEYRPQVKMPAIPALAFWARQAHVPPPPDPKKVITPGRTEEPLALPKFAAPPELAVPNRQPNASDVNIALPPVQTQPAPALPAANSATMPIRLRDAKNSQTSSYDPFAGQPVNVMALSAEPKDVRDVEIPRGMQNVPRIADNMASGAATGTGAAAAGPAGAASKGGRATGAGASEGGTGGSAGSGTGANSGSRGSVNASATAAPAATATASGVGAAPAGRNPNPPALTRLAHPANGAFDVVIMQSPIREDVAETSGKLSGNPVFTVYLEVGDQKEWVLEYCVPARDVGPATPYQINIDDEGAITPPYPISTVIPTGMMGQRLPKHIVLHGFLTATGSLQSVKISGAESPLVAELISLLGQWEFRPALRNKKPIEVEILLVIPPRG